MRRFGANRVPPPTREGMSATSLTRSRKRFRWVRWALGACAVTTAVAWFATPWYVHARLLPNLWARYGLTVTAERQDLSLAGGTEEFHGVRVFDGDEEVLAAKRVEVRISLRGLYDGRTIVDHLVFDAPVVHARIEADGRTNVERIFERRGDSQAATRAATLWREVSVHEGKVEWDDPVRGVQLRIVDIEAVVLDVETGSGERQGRFGQISIDANLLQSSHEPARLSIVHWTTASGSTGSTFVAHGALTGIDLDSFPSYVDGVQRASLGVDHVDLVVSMDVRQGLIRRGAAIAVSPERTRPLTLLFGGRFDDPVFDRSSKLVALWELPFSRFGRVGDVVWETGSAVVGGVVGAIEGIVQGDLPGAGESAVGVVRGSMLALANNALDALEGVGRRLGLVADAQARDAAAIHEHHRAQFAAARRDAAQAWSRAHSNRGA